MALRIKFDANQDYQLEAVQSVVRLFEGMPRRAVEFSLSDEVVPNLHRYDSLPDALLLNNLRAVQESSGLDWQLALATESGPGLSGVMDDNHVYPSFTIEMETGTGKTYVYLRTIYELRRRFGFGKFIVVVPSIAIYEGVVKNFQITRDHFRALYANETVNLIEYDGSQLSRLRSFASSTFCEVMVMTLDSFNKATNNLYKVSEKLPGDRRPFQFIQEARPILILDEPQNMESARAKEALRTLRPLFALRYSATHRSNPNPVYRLTPFDAYRRSLVKKIQVVGVTERENFNQPFLALSSITTQGGIRAKVVTYVTEKGRTREAEIALKQGDDLHGKTGRDEHAAGYIVTEINAAQNFVEFENGLRLHRNETIGPSRPEIFRKQIEETIEQHMHMQVALREKGIKVLSLFFIDRVANYTKPDGLIKTLFDQAFNRLKHGYADFRELQSEQVREGYFAKAKTKTKDGKDAVEEAIDTEGKAAERDAERAAFELIMRKKEQLLSFDEPVSFIFAHSALKEGWDNPNVFQICTLNQTVSPMRKRQEIGRGLRLCVDQAGERVFDEDVNILTVVANESYQNYAATLQSEYVEDGEMAPPPPTQAKKRDAIRNDDIFYRNDDFAALWDKLSRQVDYRINVDTEALIETCVARLNRQAFPEPVLLVERGRFVMSQPTIKVKKIEGKRATLHIRMLDTAGNDDEYTITLEQGKDIRSKIDDNRLKPFGSFFIVEEGGQRFVRFSNGVKLNDTSETYTFTPDQGQQVREKVTLSRNSPHPVFNLIERAVRELGITRPTINAIFKRMRDDKKVALLKNPEGFAGVFITEVRNAVADHITECIEFVVGDAREDVDLGDLFPSVKTLSQREVVEAGKRSLYDLVQKDSTVEERFIDKLRADGQVVFYFKFPPKFKVRLPSVIGNYNPDWGIGRIFNTGRIVVHSLVRETKGNADVSKLQFPHEKRKIKCAQRYFAALGIDYMPISPESGDWWKLAADRGEQAYFQLDQ